MNQRANSHQLIILHKFTTKPIPPHFTLISTHCCGGAREVGARGRGAGRGMGRAGAATVTCPRADTLAPAPVPQRTG